MLSSDSGSATASASRRATNLSVNALLLQEARALDINLSATFEAALAAEVKRRTAQKWLTDNAAGINAYNRAVEAKGVFSDGLRSF